MAQALITGITGQDGSYLAELLLRQGYIVHGIVRRTSTLNRSRIDHLYNDSAVYGQKLFLHYADLDDPTQLRRLLQKLQPDELYHLAGQSHVGLSFEIPESTCELTAMGTLRLLEILREMGKPPKLFHATSSEIFGNPAVQPQNEATPYAPVNPYGCAKVFATQMVKIYRDTFGLFACNGIMFNHESPRRGENFVTRKICRAAASIKLGLQKEFFLGDTAAQRDWGYAPDYVRGMWLIMQHSEPNDFVLATGQLHTVQDVVAQAFGVVGLDWKRYLKHDPRLFRKTEPARLVGNAEKAERVLGWRPTVTFNDLIKIMVEADMKMLQGKNPTN